MLVNFFFTLRKAEVPVSLKELLVLLEAMSHNLAFGSVDDFYLLSRTCMVKDEKYFDRFDRAFGAYFKGLDSLDGIVEALIPDEWTRAEFLRHFTEEERAKIESLGGLEKLIEEFNKRLEEQKGRHEGGNKWVGTGGTSPFGNSGYNPMGIRVGGQGRNRSAAKVWEKREFRNLADDVELGTRNIKMALRKLRKFARSGAAEELDLDDTIRSTANNAGFLDLKMVPERHNAVKVLIFFDVGGSMDPHVRVCDELFSACKTEFKHMEYFYFHNFIYETVWRDNRRRRGDMTTLFDVMHTYPHDYKVIFVGDASMAPYEITHKYGSIENMNEEPGHVWMQRLAQTYNKLIWLNPTQEHYWGHTQSIQITRQLVHDRMYPLTLQGLEQGIQYLTR